MAGKVFPDDDGGVRDGGLTSAECGRRMLGAPEEPEIRVRVPRWKVT